MADHIDAALRRQMDRSLKKVGNEIIVLTPVLDVFSPIFKMKSTAEDDLQEEVIEGQNGAVVLDGNVAAIPIAEFSNTGKLRGIVHSLSPSHQEPGE